MVDSQTQTKSKELWYYVSLKLLTLNKKIASITQKINYSDFFPVHHNEEITVLLTMTQLKVLHHYFIYFYTLSDSVC